MSLLDTTVTHPRCIEHANLEIAPGLILLWGANGSVKTSPLETTFLRWRDRSSR